MLYPCQAGSPKVYISHGVHDEVLPIDRCSRRLLPSLKQMLPQVRWLAYCTTALHMAAVAAALLAAVAECIPLLHVRKFHKITALSMGTSIDT